MNSKSMVLVAVAILAVAAVGVVVYFNAQDDSDACTVKILIQDEEGVYFWIEGEGDNAYLALVDACKKFDIPLDSSDSQYGKSIDSVFGKEMERVEPPTPENEHGVWAYWSQYSFIDGEWEANIVSIDQIKTSEIEAVALVYSSASDTPLVTPSEAKVWDHSTEGTVFTIESSTGLYFKVNGTGDKVIDAFTNATSAYGIPFVPSEWTGSPDGVNSLFGLETTQIDSVYYWWIQYVRTADGTGWEGSELLMNALNTSDTPEMKLVYGTGD